MSYTDTPEREEDQVESMSPEEVLKYMAEIGQDLIDYAVGAQAMLAEAKARGIDVDISKALEPFDPMKQGATEKALVQIRGQLLSIQGELFKQGVKMTQEELRARLAKMDLKIS